MAGLGESLRDVLGGKAATRLDEAFGLRTTADLLRHYPRRYAQRGELTDLAALRDGEHVTVFAQVARVSTFKGQRQLAHPEFKLLGADDAALAAEYAAELIPVYPASKDVSTWDIEKCVRILLDTLGDVDDPLPAPLRERYGLIGLADALRGIHRPADDADID